MYFRLREGIKIELIVNSLLGQTSDIQKQWWDYIERISGDGVPRRISKTLEAAEIWFTSESDGKNFDFYVVSMQTDVGVFVNIL